MAVPSVTVGDLVSSISFHLINNPTPDTALESEIKKHIGWVLYDLVLKSRMSAFKVETTLTLAAGTSDYELPDDFEAIIEPGVYFDVSPKRYIQYYKEQDRVQYEWTERLSKAQEPYWYTIRERDPGTTGLFNIRFLPEPDATYEVRYTYFASPKMINDQTPLVEEIDLRFPRNHVQGIVFGTVLAFPQYVAGDQQTIFKLKYDEKLEDIRRTQDPVEGVYHHNKPYRNGAQGYYERAWDRDIYSGPPPW